MSWKLDELWKKREVDFVYDNFFEDGIEGILTDLEEKLEMPENLYAVNGFNMSFNETGKVQTLDTICKMRTMYVTNLRSGLEHIVKNISNF